MSAIDAATMDKAQAQLERGGLGDAVAADPIRWAVEAAHHALAHRGGWTPLSIALDATTSCPDDSSFLRGMAFCFAFAMATADAAP